MQTIKSWEDDLYNESLNGITWHTQPHTATKTAPTNKLSRKAQKSRTKRIKAIMLISTALYIIAALLYNYSITLNVTLR